MTMVRSKIRVPPDPNRYLNHRSGLVKGVETDIRKRLEQIMWILVWAGSTRGIEQYRDDIEQVPAEGEDEKEDREAFNRFPDELGLSAR